jgi:hypothetical protein
MLIYWQLSSYRNKIPREANKHQIYEEVEP